MINKFRKIKNFIPVYFKAMRNKETPKLAKILRIEIKKLGAQPENAPY